MQETFEQIKEHISQLPFCETFLCLWHRKELREGVMPRWFTNIVNFTIN